MKHILRLPDQPETQNRVQKKEATLGTNTVWITSCMDTNVLYKKHIKIAKLF